MAEVDITKIMGPFYIQAIRRTGAFGHMYNGNDYMHAPAGRLRWDSRQEARDFIDSSPQMISADWMVTPYYWG